jgi:hypothetical protein
VLKKPEVEYRQANLTVPGTLLMHICTFFLYSCAILAAVAASFDPPEGKAPYDYVFDFTGEINHDRAEMVHLSY